MRVGRPTALTPEVIADVRRLLPTVPLHRDRGGLPWLGPHDRSQVAASRCQGSQAETATSLPSQAIFDLGVIKKASDKQWTAAAWRAERRFPHLYGSDRREIIEIKKQLAQLEASIVPGTQRSSRKARTAR